MEKIRELDDYSKWRIVVNMIHHCSNQFTAHTAEEISLIIEEPIERVEKFFDHIKLLGLDIMNNNCISSVMMREGISDIEEGGKYYWAIKDCMQYNMLFDGKTLEDCLNEGFTNILSRDIDFDFGVKIYWLAVEEFLRRYNTCLQEGLFPKEAIDYIVLKFNYFVDRLEKQ